MNKSKNALIHILGLIPLVCVLLMFGYVGVLFIQYQIEQSQQMTENPLLADIGVNKA